MGRGGSAAEALLRGDFPWARSAEGSGRGVALREQLRAAGLEALRDLPADDGTGPGPRKKKKYGRGEVPVEPEEGAVAVKSDVTGLLPGPGTPAEGAGGSEAREGSGPPALLAPSSGQLARDEVILEVAVSHGGRFGLVHQRFLVYGSQPLTELRDRIGCQADAIAGSRGLASKNSFFFVGRTFYDDTRHEGAHKLSKNVLAFLLQRQNEGTRGSKDSGGGGRSPIARFPCRMPHSQTCV